MRGVIAAVVLLGVIATPAASMAAVQPASAHQPGPDGWSDHRLAMQLVLAGVEMDQLSTAVGWADHGVGGIVLFGAPPKSLAARLARVRAAAAVPPFVASDEEGGEVQRLTKLIYRLPSAEWMGAHHSPRGIRTIATRYGRRMKALGVDMDLAPDTDLLVRGRYIAGVHRAFASSPTKVGHDANAWQRGMRSAHVAPVVKHWPGLGHSGNTDDSLQDTPRLSYLRRHDLRAFQPTFAARAPVAMVSNAVVPGLSETRRTPASLSPAALHLMRKQGGPDLLIVTDSLSAGAIRAGVGLGQREAAVRALEAGADMTLVDGVDPGPVADAIVHAMRTGHYPRRQAVRSVERVLDAKRLTTPPETPALVHPRNGATGISLGPRLTTTTNDPLAGDDRVRFELRLHDTSWRRARAHVATVPAGSDVTWQLRPKTLAAHSHYDWRAQSCNSRHYCSPWSATQTFRTG